MGKPPIKPSDVKAYAEPGVIHVKPMKDTLEVSIGVITLFLSQKEVAQLQRTLDHYANLVWPKEWDVYPA